MLMFENENRRQKFKPGDVVQYKTFAELRFCPSYWIHRLIFRGDMDRTEIAKMAGRTGRVVTVTPEGFVDIQLDDNASYIYSYPWAVKRIG